MSNFIDSSCRSFGVCNMCGPNKYGIPKTFSSITTNDGKGFVRIGDEILAECGHSGYVATGSSVVEIEGNYAATSDSIILGDYNGNFLDNINYMEDN